MSLSETFTVEFTRTPVAPRTVIEWNPQDNTGHVEFHVKVEVLKDGVFSHYEDAPSLIVPLVDILPRTFNVGGHDVPAMLLMGAIKQAFVDFYGD